MFRVFAMFVTTDLKVIYRIYLSIMFTLLQYQILNLIDYRRQTVS